jgi:glutaminyl-peptide cyclotransferase
LQNFNKGNDHMKAFTVGLSLLLLVFSAVGSVHAQDSTPSQPAPLSYKTGFPRFAHDPLAFTQGLVWHDGWLYESTGIPNAQNGAILSSLRRVDPLTGEVAQQFDLTRENLAAAGKLEAAEAACTFQPDNPFMHGELFAEGLALVGKRLIQLTWQAECAVVYDLDTFEIIEFINYNRTSGTDEGWGLCYDGQQLYMSDGSATLYVRDPQTLALIAQLTITHDGQAIPANLLPNELECVGGSIYANLLQTQYILQIDKASGVVTGVIDGISVIQQLTNEELNAVRERSGDGGLNGIAYLPERGTFLLTGKMYPYVFESSLILAPTAP